MQNASSERGRRLIVDREVFIQLAANGTPLDIGIDHQMSRKIAHEVSRKIAALAIVVCALWLCEPTLALAGTNLVRNGDLAIGSGSSPAEWYAISSKRALGAFLWTRTPTGGVLELANSGLNYSSWHQRLMLAPGVYRISAEAQLAGATRDGGGATIAVASVDGTQLTSNRLRLTTGWTELSLLLKEDRWGATTELLCQLGAAGMPDIGSAKFRDIRVVS